VHFFGHNPDDIKEGKRCRAQFDACDTKKTGVLDKEEVMGAERNHRLARFESPFVRNDHLPRQARDNNTPVTREH
jgi:hypothetical protein